MYIGSPLVGNDYQNNVVINSQYGIGIRAEGGGLFSKNTIVNSSVYGFIISDRTNPATASLANSSIISGNYGLRKGAASFIHTYNTLYGLVTNFYPGLTADPTEYCSENNNSINPNYNTPIYGNGAYLMVPPALKGKGENGADIGAEVLYRYQDGALTSQPLWPWPMEDLIFKETGVSVTWEANGGLWKTLNGVYGACVPNWQCEIPLNGYEKDGCGNRRQNASCNPDSIPPSAPQGLVVQ